MGKKMTKHHDKRRQERLAEQLRALDEPQARARLELQRRHEAQTLDMDRRLRGLAQVEARELKSLETDLVRTDRWPPVPIIKLPIGLEATR
jgi:hypothetical protein